MDGLSAMCAQSVFRIMVVAGSTVALISFAIMVAHG